MQQDRRAVAATAAKWGGEWCNTKYDDDTSRGQLKSICIVRRCKTHTVVSVIIVCSRLESHQAV